MSLIFIFLVFAGLALYLMKPHEREPVIRAALRFGEQAREEAIRRLKRLPDAAARPKTAPAFVTWIIAIVASLVFLEMLTGKGGMADPETLVSWGANFGPRTTNGEWWRLIAANFVHAGVLHFAAMAAGLLALAPRTERLVGHTAFAAVYVAAGVVAHLVHLNESAVGISAGASGGIFGVYGLGVATWVWRLLRRSPVPLDLAVAKRLAPAIAIFFLHATLTDYLSGAAEVVALAFGMISGFVLAAGAIDHRAAPRRIAALAGATAVAIVAMAVPVRGVADVRPEIQRVIALEGRIAGEYETALKRFRAGRLPAAELARQIEEQLLPELRASRGRIGALERVPREHQPFVASAAEYLRLREVSWQLRAQALRTTRIELLRKADRTEREALDALAAISLTED